MAGQHRPHVRLVVEHPRYLTRSFERVVAADMIEAVIGTPAVAASTADMLDLVAGSVLASAGVYDSDAQRAILATLWRDPLWIRASEGGDER